VNSWANHWLYLIELLASLECPFSYILCIPLLNACHAERKRAICILSARTNSRFLALLGMTNWEGVSWARHGQKIEHAAAESARAEAANGFISVAL
jgi:hypothetical protein